MNLCLLPSLTCFNIAKDASALWFIYALAPFMSWNSHLCLWPGGNWDAENSLSQTQPPWHLQLAGARAAGTWLLDASGLPRNHSSHACQSHFPEAPAMALTSTHWSLRMCDHRTLECMNMLFGCSYYRTQMYMKISMQCTYMHIHIYLYTFVLHTHIHTHSYTKGFT